jgi:hypothetical protein
MSLYQVAYGSETLLIGVEKEDAFNLLEALLKGKKLPEEEISRYETFFPDPKFELNPFVSICISAPVDADTLCWKKKLRGEYLTTEEAEQFAVWEDGELKEVRSAVSDEIPEEERGIPLSTLANFITSLPEELFRKSLKTVNSLIASVKPYQVEEYFPNVFSFLLVLYYDRFHRPFLHREVREQVAGIVRDNLNLLETARGVETSWEIGKLEITAFSRELKEAGLEIAKKLGL